MTTDNDSPFCDLAPAMNVTDPHPTASHGETPALPSLVVPEVRTIYRIESIADQAGMWYSGEGVPRDQIHVLCPASAVKELPMPLNLELHRKGGLVWHSAAKSIENLLYWFNEADVRSLDANGFKLFEIKATLFQELEHEILFCRKGVLAQRRVALAEIWP